VVPPRLSRLGKARSPIDVGTSLPRLKSGRSGFQDPSRVAIGRKCTAATPAVITIVSPLSIRRGANWFGAFLH